MIQGLNRITGIREHENQLVWSLILHNFFQGLGLALLFTASYSLFLSDLDLRYLPLTFFAAGLSMPLGARIYAHFEHHSL